MDLQFVGLLSLAFGGAVQLAGISFLLGGLFQRVRSLEARTRELESGGENDGASRVNLMVRLAQLETKFDLSNKAVTDSVAGVQREMHGLARQVAALTTRRRGAVAPMSDTLSDD